MVKLFWNTAELRSSLQTFWPSHLGRRVLNFWGNVWVWLITQQLKVRGSVENYFQLFNVQATAFYFQRSVKIVEWKKLGESHFPFWLISQLQRCILKIVKTQQRTRIWILLRRICEKFRITIFLRTTAQNRTRNNS